MRRSMTAMVAVVSSGVASAARRSRMRWITVVWPPARMTALNASVARGADYRPAPQNARSREARGAAARVLHEHPGGTVLVIGSGATPAQMIQELAGANTVPAGQGASDAIYMVSVPSFGRAHVVRIRF